MKRLFAGGVVALVIFGLWFGTVFGQESLSPETMRALEARGDDPGLQQLLSEGDSDAAVEQFLQEHRDDPRVSEHLEITDDAAPPEGEETAEEPADTEEEDVSEDSDARDQRTGPPVFGEQIFRRGPGSFSPPSNVPVSADYVIGPDDSVIVMLWGRINERHTLTVQRDGSIYFPQIGTLQVAGLTFRELQELVTQKAESIVGVNASVSMGALRSISVFVVGSVSQPGVYTVSAFDTLLNALIYAGGPDVAYPSLRGSMRKIELKRQGRTVTTFDIYDLIRKGDNSRDMRLEAGDIIFVPPPGPVVTVEGDVRVPAIYELKGERDLDAVLELAGGLKPSAFGEQIQVQRYFENRERIVLDTSLDELQKRKAPFLVNDGDSIRVFPVAREDTNAVFVFGNVVRPGRYAFAEGMRVNDILKSVDDLQPETCLDYALVRRYLSAGTLRTLVPFNLARALGRPGSADNLPLQPGDEVYVFDTWEFRDVPTVAVDGEVRNPGTIQLEEGMRIKDALLAAGNVTTDASTGTGELVRVSDRKNYTTVYFNVGRALEGDREHNLLLQNRDLLVVHSIWSEVEQKEVHIDGEVLNPGTFQYTEGMTVKDLVFKAGNLLRSAYLSEAEISSIVIDENRQESSMERRVVDLGKALDGDPLHNVRLTPDDRLVVKRVPGWREEQFAVIEGEVLFPGRYVLKKGERLSSLIERAGGYTGEAYLRGAIFTRDSVRRFQQRNLESMIQRLERDLIQQSSEEIARALSKESIQARTAQAEQQRLFIESLKELEATGRMQIQLAHLRLLKGSNYDIVLEPGDRLQIPIERNVLHVTGAVMSPGSYVFTSDMEVDNYIELAGGFTRYADEDNMYIMKVDGSARKVDSSTLSWNHFKSRWEVTAFGEPVDELEPGDTIIVPEDFQRVAWLREVKDITQVLMQMAVTAAVAIEMF